MRAREVSAGLLAMALWSTILGAVASARPDVGIIVSGSALIGETLVCTKAGGVDPVGRGLQYPQFKDFPKDPEAFPINKDRAYRLVGEVLSMAFGVGTFDVCGYMTKVAGIGPRCLVSKAYGGKGMLRYLDGTIDKITDFGWKVSGGLMLATAKVHYYDENTQEKTQPATLAGVFTFDHQVSAGESCTTGWNPLNADREAKGRGARLMTMSGVYAIDMSGCLPRWNDLSDLIDPKNDGKSSSDNIWGDKKDDEPDKEPDGTCAGGGGDPSNAPPGVPTLVSPADGHVFAATASQSFTVQADDPDGDQYVAHIEVVDFGGSHSRTMVTGPAASGAHASAQPTPALGPGTYSWRARACDLDGACGDWSDFRSVGVAGGGGTVLSDDCQTTVLDGWFGGAYLRVGTGGDGAQTSWVCLRVDHGGELNQGGRLVVTAPNPLGIAAVSTSAACPRPPGTPLLSGQVGDSSDPVGPFTYLADMVEQGASRSVCVKVTDEGSPLVDLGITVDTSGGGTPDADFLPDSPGNHASPETPPTGVRPSSDCQLAAAGKTRLVNADIEGTQVWLYAHATASATKLCARVETSGPDGGGRLTVLHGSPGALPVDLVPGAAEPDDPSSPCTANVFTNNAPSVKLRRSATSADPLGLCLGVSGVNLWALVDPSPNATPPDAQWTPDP